MARLHGNAAHNRASIPAHRVNPMTRRGFSGTEGANIHIIPLTPMFSHVIPIDGRTDAAGAVAVIPAETARQANDAEKGAGRAG